VAQATEGDAHFEHSLNRIRSCNPKIYSADQ